MEGTAAFAVAAVEAGRGLEGEVEVVVTGELVADAGKVVVFVDEAHVQAGGAGLAVVAVDAHAFGVAGCESADIRIIQFLWRGIHVVERGLEVRHVPDAGEHSQHGGAIQGILEALAMGEGVTEKGAFFVQKLASGEGLHHGDAHTHLLTIPVKGGALGDLADGVLALLVVIGGIDAEHE